MVNLGPWFVVKDPNLNKDPNIEADLTAKIWTISRDPNFAGWNTNSGLEGYGLTYGEASFLAHSGNFMSRLTLNGILVVMLDQGQWSPHDIESVQKFIETLKTEQTDKPN